MFYDSLLLMNLLVFDENTALWWSSAIFFNSRSSFSLLASLSFKLLPPNEVSTSVFSSSSFSVRKRY